MNPDTREGAGDVAIVGMACIFPGAPDLKTYWRNIVCKVDALSDPPPDWGAEDCYDPNSTANDRVYCKRGGYLHDLATFDPLESGVMPSSIEGGEPDQFLALRVAQEALADAGYSHGTGNVPGDRVEVIVGRGAYINRGFTNLAQHGLIIDQTLRLLKQLHPEYTEAELAQLRQELKASLPPFNAEMAPGLVPNILSGRIANRLDLMGPNFTVDAACASSLIAVERAMQDLLAGRCDMALTGGIHGSTPAPILMVFCLLNALSRRGKVQAFSEDADGTLLGEGLGLIVLKRTADAVRNGDRIYATIKAVGCASDGRALGLLAPRVDGEELAMRRAYDASGISPSSIGLIEAHGTGTPVGDMTEAQALARVFGARNGSPPSCALGSVKSMISHLIPAAGIAGIIKTALSLHYKVLPPTIHCDRPNPKLGLDATPLYLNTETRPWIHGLATPRRAGVNAFGFGGINTHAILEEFESPRAASEVDGGPPWDSEVLILRSATRHDLADLCNRTERLLARSGAQDVSLCDLAYSVNCPSDPAPGEAFCLGIVGTSVEDFRRKLSHCAARLADPACRVIKDAAGIYFFENMLARSGKLAFLFPGEGSAYVNMFAALGLRMPPVRKRFDMMDRALSGHARQCRPSQVIFPPPLPNDPETLLAQQRRLEQMDFAAEAVFAATQGMLDLLTECGIVPQMVAGHSGGEIAALLAGGVIRVESDAELIRHINDINQLYTRLSVEGAIPGGCAFAVSGADRSAVLQALEEFSGEFRIGMDNCPHQVVVCGSGASAARAMERMSGIGALCTLLPFQRPYHTPLFESYCDRIRPFFDRLPIGPARIPVYCAGIARPFPDDPEEIRRLASCQTALPVRFRETLEAMHDDGARVFVEAGPKGALTAFVSDTLRARPHAAIASDLPHASGILQIHHLFAHVAAHGVPVRLDRLYARRGARRIPLDGARDGGLAPKKGVTLATTLVRLSLKDRPRPSKPAAPPQAVQPAGLAAPLPEIDASAPAGSQGHSPIHAYLASMDRFLAVQEEVMGAYLKQTRAPAALPADGERVPSSRSAANVNGHNPGTGPPPNPPPPASLPAAELATVNGSGNGYHSVMAQLLEVISDRTGYPTEMLNPALNLEADLGIDSIKRVEILGALHRATGLIGPDRMERLSSLKTIREITDCLEGQTEPATLPLAGRIEQIEPGVRLVSVREFDTDRDLFLNDHALGGRVSSSGDGLSGLPFLPLTMTMEMMAEAAAALLPGQTLVGMRNVRVFQWLAIDDNKLTLRLTAKSRSVESSAEVEVEVYEDGKDTRVAEGVAIFAGGYPEPAALPPFTLQSARESVWTRERLYRDHMFHGPSFRGIESIDGWGENGMTATLVSLPAGQLFRDVPAPRFLTDPVLLDAAGQMIGYWAAEHLANGFNVFPFRIESLEVYGAGLKEGGRATCQASIRLAGDTQIHADLAISDSGGRLLMRVRSLEDFRVELPHTFYRLCCSARGVTMSTALPLHPKLSIYCIGPGAFPSFTVHGAIWLRALSNIVLNTAERQAWQNLEGPDRRRIEWLLGRVCAKDAVRMLGQERGLPGLMPADITITPGENGRPVVTDGAIRPAISIAHGDGLAVAAATLEPSTGIGIDVQRIEPSRDGFEDLAFCKEERALLPNTEPEPRREHLLRLWCAKEAAGKAVGFGLPGGPGAMIVRAFDPAAGSVTVEPAGELARLISSKKLLAVHTSRHEDFIIATCLIQNSEEEL